MLRDNSLDANNYMLTPMGNIQENANRPSSQLFRPQPQHLQKPNELDTAKNVLDSTRAGQESNTVYSGSTNEEDLTSTTKVNSDNSLKKL